MLITIYDRERQVPDVVDDARLRKTVYTATDNEDLTAVWTEYCWLTCDGKAHVTGLPDTETVFCSRHVHHSPHVTLKRWPEGMSGAIGDFTG